MPELRGDVLEGRICPLLQELAQAAKAMDQQSLRSLRQLLQAMVNPDQA